MDNIYEGSVIQAIQNQVVAVTEFYMADTRFTVSVFSTHVHLMKLS